VFPPKSVIVLTPDTDELLDSVTDAFSGAPQPAKVTVKTIDKIKNIIFLDFILSLQLF